MSDVLIRDFGRGMSNLASAGATALGSATNAFRSAPPVVQAGFVGSAAVITAAVSSIAYLIFKGIAAITGSSIAGGCAFLIGSVTCLASGVAALAGGYLIINFVAAFGK